MPEQKRAVENSHRSQGYNVSPYTEEHICYHFIVGSEGTVKQLRGINEREPCTRNDEYNATAVQIVLAGNFEVDTPGERQIKSLATLVSSLQKEYGISNDAVTAHRETPGSPTKCPGKNIMNLLSAYRNKL